MPHPQSSSARAVCAVCAGTGLKPCGQCNGSGVNNEDLFGGRFVAGDPCWLCEVRRTPSAVQRSLPRLRRALSALAVRPQGAAKTMCGACADMTDTF